MSIYYVPFLHRKTSFAQRARAERRLPFGALRSPKGRKKGAFRQRSFVRAPFDSEGQRSGAFQTVMWPKGATLPKGDEETAKSFQTIYAQRAPRRGESPFGDARRPPLRCFFLPSAFAPSGAALLFLAKRDALCPATLPFGDGCKASLAVQERDVI